MFSLSCYPAALFFGDRLVQRVIGAKANIISTASGIVASGSKLQRSLDEFLSRFSIARPCQTIPSAEAAELQQEGAASFHRQLVLSNLASEYDNDIRVWIEELKEMDEEGLNA